MKFKLLARLLFVISLTLLVTHPPKASTSAKANPNSIDCTETEEPDCMFGGENCCPSISGLPSYPGGYNDCMDACTWPQNKCQACCSGLLCID